MEKAFQFYNKDEKPLTWFIKNLEMEQLERSVQHSVEHLLKEGIPRRDLQYLFYWMIREGGQRLDGELKAFGKKYRTASAEAFPRFIADFYIKERVRYESFDWNSIEGTCRERVKRGLNAKGGVDFEALIRNAVSEAIDTVIKENVDLPVEKVDVQPMVCRLRGFLGEMTYDAVVDVSFRDGSATRIVIPCKGRGTTGGGHAAIFTRDLVASSLNLKIPSELEEKPAPLFIVPVVIAEQWGELERQFLEAWFCDVVIFCADNLRDIVKAGDLPSAFKNDLKSVFESILQRIKEPFYLNLRKVIAQK